MAHSHHFAPSKPQQEKISFECSLPQPVSSIQRVTSALPFPVDLSQSLNYTAAYLDHSAHLAKHALHQFDHLKKAHADLHAVAEGRLNTIADLECDKRTLEQKNRGLESKYTELEKHHARDVQAAKVREAQLKEQLADALAALDASQSKVADLEQYITADTLADIKRKQKFDKHISADHLRIQQAVARATKAEAEIVKLKADIEATNKKLAVAEAKIKALQEQLTASEANASKLKKELDAETQAKLKLSGELDIANQNLQKATIKIGTLENENAALDALVKSKDVTIKDMNDVIKDKDVTIKEKDEEVDNLQESWNAMSTTLTKTSEALTKKAAEFNTKEITHAKELKLKQDEIDRLQLQPVQPKVELVKAKLTPTVNEVVADIL